MAGFGTFDFGSVDLSRGVNSFMAERNRQKQDQMQQEALASQARRDKLDALLNKSNIDLNNARASDLALGLDKKKVDYNIAKLKSDAQKVTNDFNIKKLNFEQTQRDEERLTKGLEYKMLLKKYNDSTSVEGRRSLQIELNKKENELKIQDQQIRREEGERPVDLNTKKANLMTTLVNQVQTEQEMGYTAEDRYDVKRQNAANVDATLANTASTRQSTDFAARNQGTKEEQDQARLAGMLIDNKLNDAKLTSLNSEYTQATNNAELANILARTASIESSTALIGKKFILEETTLGIKEKAQRMTAFDSVLAQTTTDSMFAKLDQYEKIFKADDGLRDAVYHAVDNWDEHSLSQEGLKGKEIMSLAKKMSDIKGGDWQDYVGDAFAESNKSKSSKTMMQVGSGEKEWQKVNAQTIGRLVDEGMDRSAAALRSREETASMMSKIDNAYVGGLGKIKFAGAKFLKGVLNLPEGMDITNTETLRTYINKQILGNMEHMKGSMSDADRVFIETSEASLENSKKRLKIYFKGKIRIGERDAAMGKYWESTAGKPIEYVKKVIALKRATDSNRLVSESGTEFHEFRSNNINSSEIKNKKLMTEHSDEGQIEIEQRILKLWREKLIKERNK